MGIPTLTRLEGMKVIPGHVVTEAVIRALPFETMVAEPVEELIFTIPDVADQTTVEPAGALTV